MQEPTQAGRLLADRVAVVTGGGGGIGAATARLFAQHGAHVVIADIDAELARRTAEEVATSGGSALAVVTDVRDADQVAGLAHSVLDRHGRADVLVNNVGHWLRQPGNFVDTDPQLWDELYRLNLHHVFLVTRAFLPAMIDQHAGAIVNVSSVEGMRGYPEDPVYAAFKAAVIHFTRSLAVQIGRAGVRVNAIGPDVTESLQVPYSQWLSAEEQMQWPQWVPVGRMGLPEDQARVILFSWPRIPGLGSVGVRHRPHDPDRWWHGRSGRMVPLVAPNRPRMDESAYRALIGVPRRRGGDMRRAVADDTAVAIIAPVRNALGANTTLSRRSNISVNRMHSMARRLQPTRPGWVDPELTKIPTRLGHNSKVLFVRRKLLANGRGRWLALAVSLAVSAAIIHAQGTAPPCCVETPAPTPTAQASAPATAPHVASPAEAELLVASAPAAAQEFQFALPAGVAPEEGLQVHTIRAARAISVLFPQITSVGGFRQDPLPWHPNGLAIDVMIPNYHSAEGIELGNQIAGLALANAKRWGVIHVIWRQGFYPGIGAPSWTADYGSETANHYDHVHIATDGGGYPTGHETYFI